MIALIASAALGLYVFLPGFLFDKLSGPFYRVKNFQRTHEEKIAAGIIVALIPFLFTVLFSWTVPYVGHHPLELDNDQATKIEDYRTFFAAAYSDEFFKDNRALCWKAFDRVMSRQGRFLAWNYLFLAIEILMFTVLTKSYGRLKHRRLLGKFIARVLLRNISEWHILLTNFTFHPNEKRAVLVDVMTRDNHLYSGTIAEYFVTKDATLSGLLLKSASRFKYSEMQDDREKQKGKPIENYWKAIPGANLYLPVDNVASINIRYEAREVNIPELIIKALEGFGAKNVKVTMANPASASAPPVAKASSSSAD